MRAITLTINQIMFSAYDARLCHLLAGFDG